MDGPVEHGWWLDVQIIGSKPRPRVLVWGIEPSSELGIFINEIAPTVRFVGHVTDMKFVRQAEWDAVILSGDPPAGSAAMGPGPSFEDNLMVIQFGGSNIAGYLTHNPIGWVRIGSAVGSVATEFVVADDASPRIRKLVFSTLLPWLQAQTANDVIIQTNTGTGKTIDLIKPFIMDADRRPLAGSIELGGREWWWLPRETPNKDMWIATALSEWSKSDPTKFPAEPIWVDRPQWQTKNERDALLTLDLLRQERDRVIADLLQREQELTRKYDDSRREADRRERRLLTAQGSELVEEVHAALEEIGFKVQEMDVEQVSKGHC